MSNKGPATLLDLREYCAGRRVIITSDPHGCDDELGELLDLVEYDEEKDVLILAGDLGDRGPKTRQVYERVMKKGVFSTLGNHDHKLRRFLLKNPVQTMSLQGTIQQLGLNHTNDDVRESNEETYLEYLDSLPHIIRFSDNDYVVHAGIHPLKLMELQTAESCMYGGRYDPVTDRYGRDTGYAWYQFYEGKERIFFGHVVHASADTGNPNAIALDGGCVFGGVQRAWVSDRGIVEVKARKAYFEGYKPGIT